MAITLPLPVRVAAGLVATGVERIRRLPADLPALSVTIAGQAVRASMRVQQEISELAGRGDELLSGITDRPTDRPEWAHFDDEEEPPTDGSAAAHADRARPSPPTGGAAGRDGRAVVGSSGARRVGGRSRPTPTAGKAAATTTGRAGTVTTAGGAGTATPNRRRRNAAPGEAVPPPVAGPGPTALPSYDGLSLAQVRGRLRSLDRGAVDELLRYEQSHAARAPFLTLLTNRLTTLAAGREPDRRP